MLIAFAGDAGVSCLAKEDPDVDASLNCLEGNGLVFLTSTHALRSDPTLSARCDESQLLLGIPRHVTRFTNRKIPTAEPNPVSFGRFRRRSSQEHASQYRLAACVMQGYFHIGFLKS